MFRDFKLIEERPVYIQVKDYMKRLILNGALQADQRLPSTRELSTLINVSRNSIVAAYEELNDEGYVYILDCTLE